MPDYLLDTNILRYWYDAADLHHATEHAKVLARVEAARQPEHGTGYISRLFVSVVTIGEIEWGHRFAPVPDLAEQERYLRFVHEQCPQPLDLLEATAEYYGKLKAWLMREYSPHAMRSKAARLKQLVDPATAEEIGVDENDLWIAAQAMTHRLVLVTHDTRGHFAVLPQHFGPDLQVDYWAK